MSRVIRQIQRQLKETTDLHLKTDLLNQLVIESRDSDPASSLSLCYEALETAQSLDYKKGIAYSTLNIGYLNDFRGDKAQALKKMEEALTLFKSLKDHEGMGYSYKYLCWYYWGLGDMNKALKLMLKGLKLNENTDSTIEAWALFVIGVFYSDLKDYDLAREYLAKSLNIFKPLKYEHGIGRTLNALCTVNEKLGADEKALELGLEALAVHEGSGYQMGLARSYNDLGNLYAKTRHYTKAADFLEKSLLIRRAAKNKQAIITTLTALGNSYFGQNEYSTALKFLDEADEMASEINAKAKLIKVKQIKISVFEALDQPWKALEEHKAYSLLNIEYLSQDADSRILSMEALLNEEKKERQIEKSRLKNARLKLQKNRVQMLFGQQVSSEVVKALLKKKEQEDIQRSEATIMFLDIRNFTVFARDKDPEEVIRFQNNVFSPLIHLITEYKGIINQILGDGFMASFGIPVSDKNHAQNAFDAALSIITCMKTLASEGKIPPTRVGIGLHSGQVISGNIGNKIRKQFSIAGETVIMAARLEQLNKQYQSQLLISKDTLDRVNTDQTRLQSLGLLDLKGFDEPKEVFQFVPPTGF